MASPAALTIAHAGEGDSKKVSGVTEGALANSVKKGSLTSPVADSERELMVRPDVSRSYHAHEENAVLMEQQMAAEAGDGIDGTHAMPATWMRFPDRAGTAEASAPIVTPAIAV